MGPQLVLLPLAKIAGGDVQHAHGWALAEKHLAALEALLSPSLLSPDGAAAVIDLAGFESMSASYVKRLLVWLLIAGERFAVGAKGLSEGPLPMNVYPVITNATPDVREEVAVVLEHSNRTCFEALQFDGATVQQARLVGRTDKNLTGTLLRVLRAKEASAPMFYDRFPEEQIGVTAWNNRLNDLFARRLVWRDKRVRQFVFRPFVEEIVDG